MYSLASASILTDVVKGKEYSLAERIISDFLMMIKKNDKMKTNSLDEDQVTTMMSLSGVKEFPRELNAQQWLGTHYQRR